MEALPKVVRWRGAPICLGITFALAPTLPEHPARPSLNGLFSCSRRGTAAFVGCSSSMPRWRTERLTSATTGVRVWP